MPDRGGRIVENVIRSHPGLDLRGKAAVAEAVKQSLASVPILPGDMVALRSDPGLDYREVVSTGRDWLTLDILGSETPPLPIDNYILAIPREGTL